MNRDLYRLLLRTGIACVAGLITGIVLFAKRRNIGFYLRDSYSVDPSHFVGACVFAIIVTAPLWCPTVACTVAVLTFKRRRLST